MTDEVYDGLRVRLILEGIANIRMANFCLIIFVMTDWGVVAVS